MAFPCCPCPSLRPPPQHLLVTVHAVAKRSPKRLKYSSPASRKVLLMSLIYIFWCASGNPISCSPPNLSWCPCVGRTPRFSCCNSIPLAQMFGVWILLWSSLSRGLWGSSPLTLCKLFVLLFCLIFLLFLLFYSVLDLSLVYFLGCSMFTSYDCVYVCFVWRILKQFGHF